MATNTQRTPYLFTGKELDDETGYYYFGARYYDPRASMWISTDPALAEYLPTGNKENDEKLPGMDGVYNSPNLGLYTYAHSNPIILSDPDGKSVLRLRFNLSIMAGIIGNTKGFYIAIDHQGNLALGIEGSIDVGGGTSASLNAGFGITPNPSATVDVLDGSAASAVVNVATGGGLSGGGGVSVPLDKDGNRQYANVEIQGSIGLSIGASASASGSGSFGKSKQAVFKPFKGLREGFNKLGGKYRAAKQEQQDNRQKSGSSGGCSFSCMGTGKTFLQGIFGD